MVFRVIIVRDITKRFKEKQMITGKDLMEWGLQPGPVFKTALKVLVPSPKGYGKDIIEESFRKMLKDPEKWMENKTGWLKDVAKMIIAEKANKTQKTTLEMNAKCCPVNVYGRELIEREALDQIYEAAKLPISVQAALMPDGHSGYFLPIGGVLATKNAVIPYAVGLDIGCRMQMSIFDVEGTFAEGWRSKLENVLNENTVFGVGKDMQKLIDDPVLHNELFTDIPAIKQLWATARSQLGTSGSGNHFCEFGVVKVEGIEGEKLAVLSHSGSRGLGNKMAMHYVDIAIKQCKLPTNLKKAAWLGMDTDDGKEYWAGMNLAGDYAKACHDIIHSRIAKALGEKVIAKFENHHNFAWKEKLEDGQDVIVHRKGATPARVGDYGIIPGSMTTSSYIVTGLGNPLSIYSSSHGAGRLMSRSAAKQTFTMSQMKANLAATGVTLIGGSIDECSMGYKDIEGVMTAQKDLVRVVGQFRPVVVRMSEGSTKPWETE